MTRKLRIQYPGAIYHVINRGNYRRDVFESVGAAQAFLRVLGEGNALYGWRLHAYVVMRNHFHLAVETPEPNLVEGMHWLQSTFATRFNRLRRESGHLFQGRYRALLIENSESLRRVVDYIHLNPVRAGLVEPEGVRNFRWSSLRAFIKNERLTGLVAEDWLHPGEGWPLYLERLTALAKDQARQRELGFESFSRGWAIGTAGWRKALAQEFSQLALSPGLCAEESRAVREARWEHEVKEALRALRRTEGDLLTSGKTAGWKVELALSVRRNSGARIAWLAHRLHLGSPDTARCQLSLARRKQSPSRLPKI